MSVRNGGQFGAPRFEVIPLPGVVEKVRSSLPAGAVVTVTASPKQGIAETVTVACQLAVLGFHAVPHLSAKMIADDAELATLLDQLAAASVTEAFVVGGDAPEAAGNFGSGLELLEAISRLGSSLTLGVPGYPEGNVLFSDEVAMEALVAKSRYASYVVSQMCFDAPALFSWVSAVRAAGVSLPVRVGVPGPATAARLVKISTKIGVGESMRVLRNHRGGLLRLLKPGPWKPDNLLRKLEPGFADARVGLDGLHVYTFNDVSGAAEWWSAIEGKRR